MKEGWVYKRFGEMFNLQMGKTPSRDNSQYWNGSNVWVSIADLKDKYIENSKEGITEIAIQESGIVKIPKGIVIMSFKLTVGRASISKCDLFTNEAIMAFLPKQISQVIPDYVYYYLKGHKWVGANKAVMGQTLNKKSISENIFAYPPLPIQQQIVSELDKVKLIIENKKQQLKELDNLAQSIFYEMFGDPVENDKGWEVKKLEEVCNGIGDGLHGTPCYDSNGNFAFINGNNLVNGKIEITERTQFVNQEEANKIFIKLDMNTVLLSINGTLGKTALYNNERVVLGKSACYCRLKDNILAKFVLNLMNTCEFKTYLEDNSSKSTINNVGLKVIRNYHIITPPISLQQTFAQKIEAIEKQKELISQSIKEAETLFDSRMEYWFGE